MVTTPTFPLDDDQIRFQQYCNLCSGEVTSELDHVYHDCNPAL